ncbi:MAG TPA: hypothetical protein VFH31_02745 [Pyrinomonadaceae bacterium]|nr:hypothetical protein [Pyrinomonadaceae bacterium]
MGNRGRLQFGQIEPKTSGFEIGHDADVTQGAKPSGQTLGELQQTVNRLDGAIGKSSFQEGDNAAPMLLNALCQLAKRFETTQLCPLAPPAQGLLIFVGEDVLEYVAQADGPTEFWDNDCTTRFFAGIAPGYGSIRCLAAPRAIPSDRLPGGLVSLRTLSRAWPAICIG